VTGSAKDKPPGDGAHDRHPSSMAPPSLSSETGMRNVEVDPGQADPRRDRLDLLGSIGRQRRPKPMSPLPKAGTLPPKTPLRIEELINYFVLCLSAAEAAVPLSTPVAMRPSGPSMRAAS